MGNSDAGEEIFTFSDSETEGFDELVDELEEEDIISAEQSELFSTKSKEGVKETDTNNESRQAEANDDVNSDQKENGYANGEQSDFFTEHKQSSEQEKTQRAEPLQLSEHELFELLEQESFEADAEVAEILNEENEMRLSVKEKIRLFESAPKTIIISDDNGRLNKSKVVYIPKEETKADKNKHQELEVMYHNALENIMNPLFVFASIYASVKLILAVFNFQLNNC